MRLPSTRRSRRGGVLIATLLAVLSIGAVSMCLLQLDSTRLRQQVASIDNKRAFNLAEAGLAEAAFSVATGRSGSVGSAGDPAKFGDGLFWVEATELQPGVIGLESTGMSGSGRVTLSLVLGRQSRNLASLGLLSSQDISLGVRAQVDAYDSEGQPGLPVLDVPQPPPAPLRSNGSITLAGSAFVRGHANPGPGGVVSLGPLANVTGSTAPATDPAPMVPIEIPKLEPSGDIVHSGATALVIDGRSGSRTRLEVGAGARVVLRGPLEMVVEQLTVQGTGELEIDSTAGPVDLYVTDWVNLKASARLTFPKQDTAGFRMLVSASGSRDRDGDQIADPPVRFQPTGRYFGTLYAPLARLQLPSNYELCGTVAAERLILGDGAKVHFDAALLRAEAGSLAQVDPLSWRVIEIPVSIARDLSTDPFEALAVDASLLRKPSESYDAVDQTIHIKYVDLGMTDRSYSGAESGFDWGLVLKVISLVREPL